MKSKRYRKSEKEINGTDVGIIFSIVGIIVSVFVIIMNFIEGESKAVGVALLCSCSATLATNIRNKKENK